MNEGLSSITRLIWAQWGKPWASSIKSLLLSVLIGESDTNIYSFKNYLLMPMLGTGRTDWKMPRKETNAQSIHSKSKIKVKLKNPEAKQKPPNTQDDLCGNNTCSLGTHVEFLWVKERHFVVHQAHSQCLINVWDYDHHLGDRSIVIECHIWRMCAK